MTAKPRVAVMVSLKLISLLSFRSMSHTEFPSNCPNVLGVVERAG
jgi:hypothetical protein